MALTNRNNGGFGNISVDGVGGGLRVVPSSIQPKKFAAVAGAPTLPGLTPVAYNTSTNLWVLWDDGGSNGTDIIKGFVGLEGVALDASNEVLGNVILGGRIHADDIPDDDDAGAPITFGFTDSILKAELKGVGGSDVRSLGFTVEGVANSH